MAERFRLQSAATNSAGDRAKQAKSIGPGVFENAQELPHRPLNRPW